MFGHQYTATPAPFVEMKQDEDDVEKLPDSYTSLSELCTNPVATKLFQTMAMKKTNVCLSADVDTVEKLLDLIEKVGPSIAVLKIHTNILKDFKPKIFFPDDATQDKLRAAADRHGILIFEDGKFCDIGSTVVSQVEGGLYRFAEWVDVINAHGVSGSFIIDAVAQVVKNLEKAGNKRDLGLVMVSEMSSDGSLAIGQYTTGVLEMSALPKAANLVMGLVTQNSQEQDHEFNKNHPHIVNMTPGVQINGAGDGLGQNYNDPSSVIKKGTHLMIVGRGIIAAKDPAKAAEEYRAAGQIAYQEVVRAKAEVRKDALNISRKY